MNYFLINIDANPKSESGYDISRAFKELPRLCQHMPQLQISVGDIVYIYLNKNDDNQLFSQRIKYKCKVIAVDVVEPDDDSKYFYSQEAYRKSIQKEKYMHLQFIKEINDDRLTFNAIKEAVESKKPNFTYVAKGTKCNNAFPELFDYILSVDMD